jgi:hypothetical protein
MSDDSADIRAMIGEVMGLVLVRPPLAAEEDFFDCGGDSIRAIEVLETIADCAQLPEDLRAALLEALFDDASPAALATVVATHTKEPDRA